MGIISEDMMDYDELEPNEFEEIEDF